MTKPLLRVLGGEALQPSPVWLMRQAGRYLAEYRALRAKAGGFLDLCLTPPWAAEITLQPIRRFGLDAAILFSDILIVPWALGQELDYREGEGPVLAPVRTGADLAHLELKRLPRAIAPVLETVSRVADSLRADYPQTALIGFAGAPFTVACYMIDGRGTRDFIETRTRAYADEAFFQRLMTLLCDATIEYLSAQITAGAEVVQLFDTWAGILPPSLFRQYAIEPTARIVAAVRARHARVPVIGFPRLAGTMLDEYAEKTGVHAVGVDTSTRLAAVHAQVTLQGNLDPLALLVGGQPLKRAVSAILDDAAHRPHVFNLGHGVLPQTPPEHVADLVRQVRGETV